MVTRRVYNKNRTAYKELSNSHQDYYQYEKKSLVCNDRTYDRRGDYDTGAACRTEDDWNNGRRDQRDYDGNLQAYNDKGVARQAENGRDQGRRDHQTYNGNRKAYNDMGAARRAEDDGNYGRRDQRDYDGNHGNRQAYNDKGVARQAENGRDQGRRDQQAYNGDCKAYNDSGAARRAEDDRNQGRRDQRAYDGNRQAYNDKGVARQAGEDRYHDHQVQRNYGNHEANRTGNSRYNARRDDYGCDGSRRDRDNRYEDDRQAGFNRDRSRRACDSRDTSRSGGYSRSGAHRSPRNRDSPRRAQHSRYEDRHAGYGRGEGTPRSGEYSRSGSRRSPQNRDGFRRAQHRRYEDRQFDYGRDRSQRAQVHRNESRRAQSHGKEDRRADHQYGSQQGQDYQDHRDHGNGARPNDYSRDEYYQAKDHRSGAHREQKSFRMMYREYENSFKPRQPVSSRNGTHQARQRRGPHRVQDKRYGARQAGAHRNSGSQKKSYPQDTVKLSELRKFSTSNIAPAIQIFGVKLRSRSCGSRPVSIVHRRHRSTSPSSLPHRFFSDDSKVAPPALAYNIKEKMPNFARAFKGRMMKKTKKFTEGCLADTLIYLFSFVGKERVKLAREDLLSRVQQLSGRMRAAFMDVMKHGRQSRRWPTVWKCSLGEQDILPCHQFLRGFQIFIVNVAQEGVSSLAELSQGNGPLFLDVENLLQETPKKMGNEALIQIADMESKKVYLFRVHDCTNCQTYEMAEMLQSISYRRKLVSFGDGKVLGVPVNENIQPSNRGQLISLANCVSDAFGCELDKGEQMSNWAKETLSVSQVQYAALDAVVVGLLYNEIYGH